MPLRVIHCRQPFLSARILVPLSRIPPMTLPGIFVAHEGRESLKELFVGKEKEEDVDAC